MTDIYAFGPGWDLPATGPISYALTNAKNMTVKTGI